MRIKKTQYTEEAGEYATSTPFSRLYEANGRGKHTPIIVKKRVGGLLEHPQEMKVKKVGHKPITYIHKRKGDELSEQNRKIARVDTLLQDIRNRKDDKLIEPSPKGVNVNKPLDQKRRVIKLNNQHFFTDPGERSKNHDTPPIRFIL